MSVRKRTWTTKDAEQHDFARVSVRLWSISAEISLSTKTSIRRPTPARSACLTEWEKLT